MASSVTNYYPIVKNFNDDQVPELNDPIEKVIADYGNCDFIPKNMDLNLQTRVKDLKNVENVLETAKKRSTFHKIFSVILLAASIALFIATIIIFKQIPIKGSIHAIYISMQAILPLVSELLGITLSAAYAIFAFEARVLKPQMDQKSNDLNERIEIMKKLVEHSPAIRQKIENELKGIDLTQTEFLDLDRIKQLRETLQQLIKLEEFVKNLK